MVLAVAGCGQDAGNADLSKPPKKMCDRNLAAYQDQLLEMGFDIATMIPIKPHIKDRSKAQELVVKTSLELGQPQRALGYARQIRNWRKGVAFADYAFYVARHPEKFDQSDELIQKYLDLAEQISLATEDWRRDRIRVKIAKTHALMGNRSQSKAFREGIVDSQKGKVEGAEAAVATQDSFEENQKDLDDLIAIGNFDITQNALKSYIFLYRQFYEDVSKQSKIENKIRESWKKIPLFIRIELLMDLARTALDFADPTKALGLVEEAEAMLGSAQWKPEHYLPLKAQLISLRFQLGDKAAAQAQADVLFEFFQANKDLIVNIYRAESLQPLAETYALMGDKAQSLKVYKHVIEEGVINPNARPRAEDVSATLLSMAQHEVKPDKSFWKRLNEVKMNLQDPW
jgi:hypothetical protein